MSRTRIGWSHRRFRALALLGLITLAFAVWAYAALAADLPSPEALIVRAAPDTTKIYDRQGRLLYEVLDPRAGRRTRLRLADMPLQFRQAVMAVEDANYYSHPGIDAAGVVRAIVQAIQAEQIVSGGSTITQQLSRMLAFTPAERESRTVTRKLREMILAVRLTQAYSKDTVLEMYLNEVYFGQLAYGAEAAARTYFGKGVHELDLAESAMLAGLIQSPSATNPLVNPAAARERQRVVLGLMVKSSVISDQQAADAQAEPPHYATVGQADGAAILRAPHFVAYVRNLLEAQYGAERVNGGGLRVTTTLDLDLQERAEAAVRARLDDLKRRTRENGEPNYRVGNAALVALDPRTGEIRALVGSADYYDASIDGAVDVALSNRQPGSAIKPIIYATAFMRDYTPATVLSDVPTAFTTREGDPYQPQNYDTTWHGPISLRAALATSSNMVAVKVLDHVGIDATLETAKALGITTYDNSTRFGLSLALGGGEVSLLELTGAYAAFANAGRRVTPVAIRSVTAAGEAGTTGPDRNGIGAQAISPQVAYLITSILSDDAARIPAFGEDSVLHLSRPAAAKTGTTSDFRDNWTVGYTPDLVTGVWVGNADNRPMYQVSGITGAGPIWHDFMEIALAGLPAREFERPPAVISAEICDTSGLLATDLCQRRHSEWFVSGSEPLRADDSYVRADVDSVSGMLWSAGCRGERVSRVFRVLPPEARDWGREQGIAQLPGATCDAPLAGGAPADADALVMVSPAPHATFALTSQLPPAAQQIEIAARSGGASLRAVTLLVDGQAVGQFAAPPYRVLWQLAAGEHTAQAIGTDVAGNAVASAVLTFSVRGVAESR
ncbi:MAG: PBP1A family penicillin-binding protein [Chloroflexi bacterium]|nr:PBP1A family penicillin-binding protein [Chloroflexota bacterium]